MATLRKFREKIFRSKWTALRRQERRWIIKGTSAICIVAYIRRGISLQLLCASPMQYASMQKNKKKGTIDVTRNIGLKNSRGTTRDARSLKITISCVEDGIFMKWLENAGFRGGIRPILISWYVEGYLLFSLSGYIDETVSSFRNQNSPVRFALYITFCTLNATIADL